ncbi:MAG: radical SAM protein [Clostridiales Family XIII bacterium]|jgi:anaerobic ribonucleoside-triphosphate reductase activating protein|nr:radical SAM protein [Clostridiales Family XIII bacterium]
MGNRSILVSGIVEDSIVDGPGLRLVVFAQGCDKRCLGCHNPDSQPMEGGTPHSAQELFRRVAANPLCSGVTLSGGEPLLQAASLLPFARLVKGAGLSLAIYTGDTFEQIMERADEAQMELISLADTLIDGPFIEAQKSLALPFRGSANQRILDAPKSLETGAAVISKAPAWNPKG